MYEDDDFWYAAFWITVLIVGMYYLLGGSS